MRRTPMALRVSTKKLAKSWLAALLMAVCLLPIAGCGGCLQDPVTAQQEAARKKLEEDAKRLEEERKRKEEEKPPIELGRFMTQPNELDRVEASYKPGHWSTATLDVIANKEDFHGSLATLPFKLDNMPYDLGTSRPVSLAKGQRKAVEVTFYVPPYKPATEPIRLQLMSRGDRPVGDAAQPTSSGLRDHTFYFMVLARTPERYTFIRDLDSVLPPSGMLSDNEDQYYKVFLPRIEQRTPLPSNPLCWTSIAYVLWDDLHPDKLTPEQQQAMLDWIHWGGQVIISGPGTLPELKGSFIEPYLPADAGDAWDISFDTLSELNQKWNMKGPLLRPASPWSGQKLTLRSEANVLVNSVEGPLLVERRLGLGRIVLSGFRLGQRELQDWKSFDGFLNACLLRRPPRRFELSEMADVRVRWADNVEAPTAPAQYRLNRLNRLVRNTDDPSAPQRLNPHLVSSVRIYSRDTDLPKPELAQYRAQHKAAELEREPEMDAAEALRLATEALKSTFSGEEEKDVRGSGVAGWKDTNAVAQLARDSLSGGIVIPEATFILWVLGAYLMVLVPLNFLVFRLMGHVEWAWLAVPFITVGFAVAVVRLAQLDVGFVRTQSEVGVLELQANYQRAHVTRYTALYSSLSTTYDMRFTDPNALVQPLPTARLIKDQARSTVYFQRDLPATRGGEKLPVGLSGFDVPSNSQAMLHSEHMMDVGGPIVLRTRSSGGKEVVNNSEMALEDAVVIGPEGVAWIGKLAPGAATSLAFRESQPDPMLGATNDDRTGKSLTDIWIQEREQSPTTARRFPPEVLNIRQLIRLAQNSTPAEETRLVAWTRDELPGLYIEPAASQSRHANVVIARLELTPTPTPLPDKNTHADIAAADTPDDTDSKPQN